MIGSTAAADFPALAEWAGDYRGHVGHLRIERSGRFSWRGLHFPGGGDAGIPVEAHGKVQLLDGTLLLTLDRDSIRLASGARLPPPFVPALPDRLFPVRIGDRRLLPDEKALIGAINLANGYRQRFVGVQTVLEMRDDHTSENTERVAVEALLPAAYRNRLLSSALVGRVVAIDELVSESGTSRHSARLTVDLGRDEGVFVGMDLYLGPRSMRYILNVDRVEQHRCQAPLVWWSDGPEVGTRVSSAYYE
jgi:hypothetical protein